MKYKKILSTVLAFALCLSALAGCNAQKDDNSQSDSGQSGEKTDYSDAKQVVFSESGITVDGKTVAEGEEAGGVSVGGEIIYYHNMDSYKSGNIYGEGGDGDKHTEEEAAAHTLVTITEAGTYRISGTLSRGQLAVDLGEDAVSDPSAVVTLVLDGADITCEVAPAVIFYNVYECSDSSVDTKGIVDTSAAGAVVVIADGSENHINGSYVAKIYKDNTEQKKLAKYDGAFYSKRTMNINGGAEGSGKLYIEAENEGLDSELHLTINGGNIYINSRDDGINTNEDNISVTTVNGGYLYVNGGLGAEGDGIDSNGYITINGGTVLAIANGKTGDGGIDADLDITINGGVVTAFGSRNDSVSENSGQNCMELTFSGNKTAAQGISVKDSSGNAVIEAVCEREFSSVTLSSPELEQNVDYSVYVDGVKQAYTAVGVEAGPGGMNFGGFGEKIEFKDPIVTELPDGFEEWIKSDDNIPDNIREWLEDISRSLTGQPIETPRPVEPKLETEESAGSGDEQMSTMGQPPENNGNQPPEKPDGGSADGENEANLLKASDVFVLTGVRTSFVGVADA